MGKAIWEASLLPLPFKLPPQTSCWKEEEEEEEEEENDMLSCLQEAKEEEEVKDVPKKLCFLQFSFNVNEQRK